MKNHNILTNNSFLKSFLFLTYLGFSHLILRFILRIYRVKGGNKRSIVFLGDLNSYSKFIKEIDKYPWMGYKVAKWYSFSNNKQKSRLTPDGNYEDMKLWLKNNNPDLIVITKKENYLSFDKLLTFLGDTHYTVCYFESWFNLVRTFVLTLGI